MAQATKVQCGIGIDYTPTSAVAAGQVVVQNALVGIATRPIDANTTGALEVEGVFDVAKVTGAINAGVNVYWDADGDPLGGTPGSGAATATDTANTLMGKSVKAAGASDTTVRVRLLQ